MDVPTKRFPWNRKKINDYTGITFGFLTAIKPINPTIFNLKNNTVYTETIWEFKCICGKIIQHPGSAVFTRKNGVKSCGCKSDRYVPKSLGESKRFKGVGQVTGKYFLQIKNSAKDRNHCFNISIEYISNLFEIQNYKCALTGLKLILLTTAKNIHLKTASLDRIDSSKGYVEGNVQWIHKDVNRMKSNLSQPKFIQYCKLISLKCG